MKIRVAVTGRSYHNTEHLPDELLLTDAPTVDNAIAQLGALLPPGQTFAASCLVAVGGRHLGTIAEHESCRLQEGDELVLIAPMAGG